jgi:hypothetical protein
MQTTPRRISGVLAGSTAALALLAGCASTPSAEPRAESAYAITASNQLVSFNTGTPGMLAGKQAVSGLQPGERLLGIDVRPANGMLYALGSSGRLYTLNPATGAATQVGTGTFAVALTGTEFGFDFNPTVDRIRVVSDSGQNLRLHPDTGAVVDANPDVTGVQTDGALAYAAGDTNVGKKAMVVGAAYTNSMAGAKATTNFAIDATTGALVTQGSREGAAPAVSPNTGQLFTVGVLGVAVTGMVAFDIDGKTGAAFVAAPAGGASQLYLVDLMTGKASSLGTIGGGEAVRALAVK